MFQNILTLSPKYVINISMRIYTRFSILTNNYSLSRVRICTLHGIAHSPTICLILLLVLASTYSATEILYNLKTITSSICRSASSYRHLIPCRTSGRRRFISISCRRKLPILEVILHVVY